MRRALQFLQRKQPAAGNWKTLHKLNMSIVGCYAQSLAKRPQEAGERHHYALPCMKRRMTLKRTLHVIL